MIIKKKNEADVLVLTEYEAGAGQKIPMFQFPLLEQSGIVKHCFTTRMGGVSRGIFSSMNLSFTRGDEETAVRENFRRVAAALEVSDDSFVFSDQKHTINIKKVTKADAGRERSGTDVDGLITDEPGLTLSTFYADCVPLYFVDPVRHAIGLSHSGWRGTAGRIGEVTVLSMQREFGTRPKDLICAIGPSICRDCYEVSFDVADVFLTEFAGHESEILSKGMEGKYQLDLWKANEVVLTEAGVLQEHIAVTNICTCCNPKILFSHRASKGKRGNMGAFLALK